MSATTELDEFAARAYTLMCTLVCLASSLDVALMRVLVVGFVTALADRAKLETTATVENTRADRKRGARREDFMTFSLGDSNAPLPSPECPSVSRR
jgi:hypothetical protein